MAGVRKRLGSLLGPTGQAAGIGAATAETIAASTPPQVVTSGPNTAKAFHFKIPQGPQGLPGTNATPTAEAIAQNLELPGTARTAARAAVESFLGTVLVKDGAVHADYQAAANLAASTGKRFWAAGTLTTDQTLTITSDCDLGGLTIRYTGTGLAVRAGVTTGFLSRKNMHLPHVVAIRETTPGWSAVAGTVGIEISNLYTADVTVPQITDFETGLRINGLGQGVSYVNIYLGHLFNNKVNMHFTANATGWVNQNSIFGGRMSHNSEEGVKASGTRHVKMDLLPSKVNNNNFFGTSLESPNVVEYHLDCAGNDNYFWGCRWENTGEGARVIWRAGSVGNLIDGGFGLHTVVETRESGTANHLRSRAHTRMVGDPLNSAAVLTVENSSSAAAPALRVMSAGAESAGADKSTAWVMQSTAQKLAGKRVADAFPRIELDYANGAIRAGDGTVAPTKGYSVTAGIHSLVGAATKTTAPASGAGAALPAAPAEYVQILVGSSVRWIPVYA